MRRLGDLLPSPRSRSPFAAAAVSLNSLARASLNGRIRELPGRRPRRKGLRAVPTTRTAIVGLVPGADGREASWTAADPCRFPGRAMPPVRQLGDAPPFEAPIECLIDSHRPGQPIKGERHGTLWQPPQEARPLLSAPRNDPRQSREKAAGFPLVHRGRLAGCRRDRRRSLVRQPVIRGIPEDRTSRARHRHGSVATPETRQIGDHIAKV